MPKFTRRERERERVKTPSDNNRFGRKRLPRAVFFAAGFLLLFTAANASSTNGTIDSTNRYAWSETAGWLDFGGSLGAVAITDSALSGYAFSETLGWLSLNCSNTSSCATVDYKISNNGNGTLTGYAWGENTGWVRFDPTGGGVSINSSGVFSGYAYGENIGWIVFNCSTTSSCATVDYKVSTDWRPRNARPACNNASDDDGDGKTDYSADPGCASADDTDETDLSGGGGAPGGVSVPREAPRQQTIYPDGRVVYWDEQPPAPVIQPTEQIASVIESVSRAIESVIPSFLKKGPSAAEPSAPPSEALAPETLPPVFGGDFNLLPARSIGRFALAPLPREIAALAKKFPELGRTFAKLGITKISDLDKLQNATFVLPGLKENLGLKGAANLSLSALSATQKALFPSEIVFAKSGDLIDYDIHLALNAAGAPEQLINTIAGKTLELIVKVDKPAKTVKGYLTVKNIERQTARRNVPATSLMASPILAALSALRPAGEKNIEIEKKMLFITREPRPKAASLSSGSRREGGGEWNLARRTRSVRR